MSTDAVQGRAESAGRDRKAIGAGAIAAFAIVALYVAIIWAGLALVQGAI